MKLNKYMKRGFILMTFLVAISSCETLELSDEQLTSPNNPSLDVADPDLLLNSVILNFENFLDQINNQQMEFARMESLFGAYTGQFAMTPASLDNDWGFAYSSTLQDSKTLKEVATNRELTAYVAIAQLIEAYTYVTLVDTWGKVPFSEALLGAANANPNPEDGQVIYDAIYNLIDEALAELNTAVSSTPVPDDLFYGGDVNKWIKLGNTLKLKMYHQSRLVNQGTSATEITSLVNSGNLILSSDEDFQFEYSSVVTPADSRHPKYIANYTSSGAGDYMSNYYMNLLKDDKSTEDPRLRYYIYRQIDEDPEGDFLPCASSAYPFCYIGDFYWGRDHGDSFGVPNDPLQRSTWGLYPVGGAFDNDAFLDVTKNPGTGGAGILPIMTSSFVNFILAESALTLGTPGNARTYLENGVRESMNKVLNFNTGEVDPAFAATDDDVNDYVAEVLSLYDAAGSDTERLDVISKEYLLALFGNGIEAYNNYRKTGLPSDIQDPVINAGEFPRSYFYPPAATNNNNNISQKPVTEQVFWDNNPSGFIN